MAIKLSIIGYGKLGKALVEGFKQAPEIQLSISSPSFKNKIPTSLAGHACFSNNLMAVEKADVVLLCVKPNVILHVIAEISSMLKPTCCLVSVAAGITLNSIKSTFNNEIATIRAMPNTSAAVLMSPTALYANNNCQPSQKELLSKLFGLIGEAIWLQQEEQLDVMTALVGSGPAFVYEFIMALSNSVQSLGLDEKSANILACQMLSGASTLASQNPQHVSALQQQVISKGGTTEAGIKVLIEQHFSSQINKAILAAVSKAKSLGQDLRKT